MGAVGLGAGMRGALEGLDTAVTWFIPLVLFERVVCLEASDLEVEEISGDLDAGGTGLSFWGVLLDGSSLQETGSAVVIVEVVVADVRAVVSEECFGSCRMYSGFPGLDEEEDDSAILVLEGLSTSTWSLTFNFFCRYTTSSS